MKKLFCILAIFFCMQPTFAKHIIGGEMIYQYLGKGTQPNTLRYRVILKLFRDQNSPPDAAAMPADVYIGFYNNDSKAQFPNADQYFDVFKATEDRVTVNPFPDCIISAPSLSYNVARYTLDIDLPVNATGYTAAYQTCCRVSPIENVFNSGGNSTGSTFSCNIPPLADSSPEFSTSIDAICGGKPFMLNFGATDPDGDSLIYSFVSAFDGGYTRNATNINPLPPPYSSVDYRSGYTALTPLGDRATIDSKTGVISGFAPPIGRYLVTVAVASYRNGLLISTNQKDFIVNVTNCDFSTARLDPKPVQCDSFTVSFSNSDFSPLNKTFYWEFGDPSTGVFDTSTLANPKHTYSDTGVYVYKLVVNPGDPCSDSTTQTVKVYPGFRPAFDVDGRCINSDILFTDRSTSRYGNITSWKWDFGVASTKADTAITRNTKYNYSTQGSYPVALTITSSKGCSKTFTDTVSVLEKPPFNVTNDTLICNIDTLQLQASGSGSVVWTPNYNINNVNSFNPLVSPDVTTTYYANYEESRGCSNLDSVVVNVVRQVTLKMPADTTVCLTDSLILKPTSDGLHYQWTPSASLLGNDVKFPTAVPTGNTTYQVTASIGKCNTTGRFNVRTVPYPQAFAGNDTAICVNTSVQLHASGGSIYEWQPAVFLDDNKSADPTASPFRSVQYILKVNDVLGCPKPTYDTMLLKVIVPFVDAGPRDTAIVVGQPLQLFAESEAENFLWTPSTGLNNPFIQNPIALLSSDQEYIVRIIVEGGCEATDTIMVKVYKLKPGFYVPNAFTPNNDGLNDQLKPIAIGLKSMKYFNVYNRAGQLIFTTQKLNKGWDGTFKGSPQDSNTFVWTAEGVDYLGNLIVDKGTFTLIR